MQNKTVLAYATYYALTYSQEANQTIVRILKEKIQEVFLSNRLMEKATLLEVLDFLKICRKNAKEIFKGRIQVGTKFKYSDKLYEIDTSDPSAQQDKNLKEFAHFVNGQQEVKFSKLFV